MSIPARLKSPTDRSARGLDRRQLLKAGAWSAPALVAAVAVPAAVASAGTVPIAQITVQAYDLSNDNAGGTPGPLTWAGGQIGWWNAPQSGPAIARISYTVILTGPGGLSVPLVPAGVANIAKGQAHVFPAVTYGTKPMAGGQYTVTLTAFADDGSSSAQKSVTLAPPPPSPVTASYAVTTAPGNKHDVTLTLTGTPGTLVTIGIQSWEVKWNTAFPATATIGANGSVSVTANANATGRTPGGLNIALSSSVPVNPGGFYNIPIPV
jgi:hypothetical protein